MRMKALRPFDCRVQVGINRVVNTSTLVQECRFMGKNKVEGGLNTEKNMNFRTLSLSVWKKELPDAWEVSVCPSTLLSGEGAPQPLATHTHRAAGNRTRFAIFFL